MAWRIPDANCILHVLIVHLLFYKPVFCTWSSWGEWSDGACSVTCGEGNRIVSRARYCNSPNNDCVGSAVDKKTIRCQSRGRCGDLTCYECNIFRSGKIIPCKESFEMNNCRSCLKSYTKIHLHDRQGYARDSVVVSKQCVRHHDFSEGTKEGCTYRTNNGGFSVLCHCFSDRCNTGVPQGSSPALIFFIIFASILKPS